MACKPGRRKAKSRPRGRAKGTEDLLQKGFVHKRRRSLGKIQQKKTTYGGRTWGRISDMEKRLGKPNPTYNHSKREGKPQGKIADFLRREEIVLAIAN